MVVSGGDWDEPRLRVREGWSSTPLPSPGVPRRAEPSRCGLSSPQGASLCPWPSLDNALANWSKWYWQFLNSDKYGIWIINWVQSWRALWNVEMLIGQPTSSVKKEQNALFESLGQEMHIPGSCYSLALRIKICTETLWDLRQVNFFSELLHFRYTDSLNTFRLF